MPKTNKKTSKKEMSDAEKALMKAAHRIEKAGLRDYVEFMSSPWRVFGINFLVGTARGLGLIIGVAIVLGIIVYILTQVLIDLPIVGDFFQSLYDFLRANGLPEVDISALEGEGVEGAPTEVEEGAAGGAASALGGLDPSVLR